MTSAADGPPLWRAHLEGHVLDLQTLAQLFPPAGGDPEVVDVGQDTWALQSARLGDPTAGNVDVEALQLLHRHVNALGRLTDAGYQPVALSGVCTSTVGGVSITAPVATFRGSSRMKVGGVGPVGARLLTAADDPDVADVLRILGGTDPLDWYDLYKVTEIIEGAEGGHRATVAAGLMTAAQRDRFRASANHPGLSGDAARHARMPGTPAPDKAMSLADATALVRDMARTWVASRAG